MNFIDIFSDFKSGKNIDRPTMMRVLEDVFRTLIKKKYGSDENFDVIVNPTKWNSKKTTSIGNTPRE